MSRWLCAVAALAFGCFGGYEAPTRAIATQPPTIAIARGAYVAALAGCKACHTPDGGSLHAPNITPDAATGIGSWSDAQVIVAIRQGVRPDGGRLAPTMPYPFFHFMTDADAEAVVAYLRAQPPRQRRIARLRSGLAPIELAAPVGNVDPVGDRDAHGAYLAALMHCAGCHGADYSGGQRFGDVIAANLTSDPRTGLGSWTEGDVVRAIREMKDPDGQPIHGPMARYRGVWATMSDTDAHAVAGFIKALPPVHHDVPNEGHSVSRLP